VCDTSVFDHITRIFRRRSLRDARSLKTVFSATTTQVAANPDFPGGDITGLRVALGKRPGRAAICESGFKGYPSLEVNGRLRNPVPTSPTAIAPHGCYIVLGDGGFMSARKCHSRVSSHASR